MESTPEVKSANLENLEESEVFVGGDSDNDESDEKKVEAAKMNGEDKKVEAAKMNEDKKTDAVKVNGEESKDKKTDTVKVNGEESKDNPQAPKMNGSVEDKPKEDSKSRRTSGDSDHHPEANGFVLTLTQEPISLPLDGILMSASCETSIISVTSSMDYEMETNTKMLSSMTDSCAEELQASIVSSKCGSESDVSRSTEAIVEKDKPDGKRVSLDTAHDQRRTTPEPKRNGRSSSGKTTPRLSDPKPPCTCGSSSSPVTPRTPRRATTIVHAAPSSLAKKPNTDTTQKSSKPSSKAATPRQERGASASKTPERSRSGTATPAPQSVSNGTTKPNQTGARAKSASRSSSMARCKELAKPKPDRCKERKSSGKSDQSDVTPPDRAPNLRRRRVREGKDTGDSSSQDSRGSDRFQLSRSVSVRDRVSPDSAPDSRPNALDKYGTLPRRKKTNGDQRGSREPSITRASLLRFWKTKEDLDSKERQFWFGFAKDSRLVKTATSLLSRGGGLGRCMPPMPPRGKERTLICAEAGVQTVLTSDDVQQALGKGADTNEAPLGEQVVLGWRSVRSEQAVQTEGGDVSRLELQLRQLQEEHRKLQEDHRKLQEDHRKLQEEGEPYQKQLEKVNATLEEERAEKAEVQKELERTAQRVVAMLESMEGVEREFTSRSDNIHDLQNQLQVSNQMIASLQEEANFYRNTSRTLQQELDKSTSTQKTMFQQLQESESEAHELQDFMQAEKNMMAEALKEAENEINSLKEKLAQKESDLKQQQAQCHHLVRISEQRRHEYLTLQSRVAGMQGRAHDLLLQQGAEASSVAISLSDLSARLDTLVQQLLTAYAISQKEIDTPSVGKVVVPIEPEKSQLSPDTDILKIPSPKKGASLVTAVLHALNNAASSPFSRASKTSLDSHSPDLKTNGNISEVTHVSNGHSSEEHTDPSISPASTAPVRLIGSESLQNLSDAIQRRRGLGDDPLLPEQPSPESREVEMTLPVEEEPPPFGDAGGFTLQDQVAELDRSVTKLLRILQIIQLENDSIIDEIHSEKLQLMQQIQDLRAQLKSPAPSSDGSVQNGHEEKESEGDKVSLQKEMAQLHEKLDIKDRQLEDLRSSLSKGRRVYNNGWTWTASEVQRLNDVISNVLETLQGIPSVVANCPALAKLQHELQNINTSLPSVDQPCNSNSNVNGGDLNANPPAEFPVHTNRFQPVESPSDMPQQQTTP